jgi:hypothetical protein
MHVTEPADATKTPAEALSAEEVPVAGTADPGEAEATVKGSPEAAWSSGQRLRPGALRSLVHGWLAERPGQEFTPTRIGKKLGRSTGAVGNALATMTDQGEVVQTSRKPRRYALAEGGDQAATTQCPNPSESGERRFSVVLGHVSDRLRISSVMGCPRQRTWPVSGSSTPRMMRMAVVLPAPLGPTNPNSWPSATVNDRSSRATTSP